MGWGVVLMTVAYSAGPFLPPTLVYYGDPAEDTYSGWYEEVEICAKAARDRNRDAYGTWPRRTFACMRQPAAAQGKG